MALDVHKHYTWARVENDRGDQVYECKLAHGRGTIGTLPRSGIPGLPWRWKLLGTGYWVVDEIEAGRGLPQLVNGRLAKLMIGSVNKSDKLDAKGMNRLQRSGTLPVVWIPPASVRVPASCRARAWC